MKSLLEHLNQVPPFVARRLAKEKGRWMDADEIARRSGLSTATVMRYSRMPSWASIPVEKAQAFAAACGHDLVFPQKALKYLARTDRDTGFRHLPPSARRQFAKLLRRYGKR